MILKKTKYHILQLVLIFSYCFLCIQQGNAGRVPLKSTSTDSEKFSVSFNINNDKRYYAIFSSSCKISDGSQLYRIDSQHFILRPRVQFNMTVNFVAKNIQCSYTCRTKNATKTGTFSHDVGPISFKISDFVSDLNPVTVREKPTSFEINDFVYDPNPIIACAESMMAHS